MLSFTGFSKKKAEDVFLSAVICKMTAWYSRLRMMALGSAGKLNELLAILDKPVDSDEHPSAVTASATFTSANFILWNRAGLQIRSKEGKRDKGAIHNPVDGSVW